MKKVKYKDRLKTYKKNTTSNLIVVGGIFALDFITVMLTLNMRVHVQGKTEATSMILAWAIGMFILLNILLVVIFSSVRKGNFKLARLLMRIIIALSVLNMATYVMAQYFYSVILIVAILILLYMQERCKEFIIR